VAVLGQKGGTPYIKPKKNSLMKLKGWWTRINMVPLIRKTHTYSAFYKLRQRVEVEGIHQSIVGNIIRNRTKTLNGKLVKNYPRILSKSLLLTNAP
jgi:hypothetical protein